MRILLALRGRRGKGRGRAPRATPRRIGISGGELFDNRIRDGGPREAVGVASGSMMRHPTDAAGGGGVSRNLATSAGSRGFSPPSAAHSHGRTTNPWLGLGTLPV